MLAKRSFTRLARHIAVAATSLVVLSAAAAYALAPASEAIAATAAAVASSGHSAVEGKILQGKAGAKGARVEVLGPVRVRRHGKWVRRTGVVGHVTVGASGKFSIRVKPGRYAVVLQDGSKARKTLHVTVKSGKSIFIAAAVKKQSGAFSIAPVIFNY